jgi:hypothetical protein
MELESYFPTKNFFFLNFETDANAFSTEIHLHFESLLRLPLCNGEEDVTVHIYCIYCSGDLGSQLVHLSHAI